MDQLILPYVKGKNKEVATNNYSNMTAGNVQLIHPVGSFFRLSSFFPQISDGTTRHAYAALVACNDTFATRRERN